MRRTGVEVLDQAIREHVITLYRQVEAAAALEQLSEVEYLLVSLESTLYDLDVLSREVQLDVGLSWKKEL